MGLFTNTETQFVTNAASYRPAPPPGSLHSVPMPGTKTQGRTEIYRHWRCQNELVQTLDPMVKTLHDVFETAGKYISVNMREVGRFRGLHPTISRLMTSTKLIQPGALANQFPKNRCLGWRPYDPLTKTYGQYQWMDYATVQHRRTTLGRAIVQLHEFAGITGTQHAVGLWCQNRPEWQITGVYS